MRFGQRLVGVELHAERPGEAAQFYAWLLGPGAGGEPTSWSPVSLLFEHAVCAVHAVEPSGPPPSWVPVVAVHGLDGARQRASDEGMHVVDVRERTYLVDKHGVWTRIVDAGEVPVSIDPYAVTNAIADLNVPDARLELEAYARVLELDLVTMLDDVGDYHLLLDQGVLALGGLWYDHQLVRPLEPGWIVYFDIANLEETVERGARAGVEIAVPTTKEDFNVHAVLVDPFGTPFGFCTYFDIAHSEVRVLLASGEVTRLPDAVRLLVDPRPHPLSR